MRCTTLGSPKRYLSYYKLHVPFPETTQVMTPYVQSLQHRPGNVGGTSLSSVDVCGPEDKRDPKLGRKTLTSTKKKKKAATRLLGPL